MGEILDDFCHTIVESEKFTELEDEDKIDRVCDCARNSLSIYFVSSNIGNKYYVFILMFISMVFDAGNFFTIAFFKGLQAHPMMLFMWISFASFSLMWSLIMFTFVCNFSLDKVLAASCGMFTVESHWEFLKILMKVIPFQVTFFNNMIIGLNICLSLDLILTLRNPFMKSQSRYVTYVLITLIVAAVPAFQRVVNQDTAKSQFTYGWIVVVIFFIYIVTACYSIFFGMKFLFRPGISSEARKMTMRRHVFYIAMNILCQVYNFLSRLETDIDPTLQYDHWCITTFAVFFFGQGIFLNIVRWFEPGYLEIVRNNLQLCQKKGDR